LVFTVIYVAYEAVAGAGVGSLQWSGAWWLAPHFFGFWLITYLAPKGLMGGIGALSQLTVSLILIAFSLGILFLAVNAGIPDPEEAKATVLAGEPGLFG
jgi:hypothetical protein